MIFVENKLTKTCFSRRPSDARCARERPGRSILCRLEAFLFTSCRSLSREALKAALSLVPVSCSMGEARQHAGDLWMKSLLVSCLSDTATSLLVPHLLELLSKTIASLSSSSSCTAGETGNKWKWLRVRLGPSAGCSLFVTDRRRMVYREISLVSNPHKESGGDERRLRTGATAEVSLRFQLA